MSRGIALPFHGLGTWMGVGGQHHAPAALPPGKNRYPLYRRLGRPQGRPGRGRKISTSPGFDPRTVQPVASRYTDCAIQAPVVDKNAHKLVCTINETIADGRIYGNTNTNISEFGMY